VRQAGLYPNPTVSFEAEDIPENNIRLNRSNNTISISQPIYAGRQRSKAVLEASAKRDAIYLSIARKSKEILSEVHLVYIELLYLKRAQMLYEDLIATAGKSNEIARVRFDSRAVTEVEVFKTQIKVYELEMSNKRLPFQISAASQRLRSLLSGVPLSIDKIKGSLLDEFPHPDLKQLTSMLQANHPGILSAWRLFRKVEIYF